ncbi:MAG: putative metallopeptidase [Candidatus Nanoarchaeia archaeon]|jgi:predicted metallopeptidase
MNLKFERARAEEELIKYIAQKLGWNYLNTEQIRCLHSYNSSSKCNSRISGSQKIFCDVFKIKPSYVIELLQPNFEKLTNQQKTRQLIIALLHIPKTFSGETKKFLDLTENDIQKLYEKVII